MTTLLDKCSQAERSVLVTGAGSGLERGFARASDGCGATRVLGARRFDRLNVLADGIARAGGRVLGLPCDVTHPRQSLGLAAGAAADFAWIDVLVDNTCVGTALPTLCETPDAFRAVASVIGVMKSYAPHAAYATSKVAENSPTRDLSQQWAARPGIRVNAVAGGYDASELTAGIPAMRLGSCLRQTTDLGRTGLRQELERAVRFLASDSSSDITGPTVASKVACRTTEDQ
jgi:NAD(P)-dependent dehydrogenase (short-subunit alcohol dehydrogenase family)